MVALVAPAPGAGVLAAQPYDDPDLDTTGMRRTGPFHLRPFVFLKDVGYDDNIRLESQEAEGDSTATGGTGLDGLVRFGHRGALRFSPQISYTAFGRNTDLNHWSGQARARGLVRTGKVLLSVEDRFSSVRERPNTEVDLRLRRETHAAALGLKSLQKGRLGARALLVREGIDYASEEAGAAAAIRRLTRDRTSLLVAGELRVRPKTTLLLEGVLERVDFEDRAESRDTRSRAVLPGVRFDPSASIQGELRIGVLSLDAPDRPRNDFHGVIGSGNLRLRLGHASRVKLRAARDLEFSTLADNLYYIGSEWTVAFEQFFSRRLSAEVGYGRGLNHYPEPVTRPGDPGFQGIRDDRLTTWQAAARYRIQERLALVAAAYRLERDSTDDFHDRERTLYTIGTTIDF